MPPVGAAIGAAASAIGASVSTALAGATFSGFAVKAFTQIAIGVAFSALGRMLMPGQKLARRGVRTSVGFGEDAPATIVLGRTATAGDLVYANSHGPDNEYYVLVLELSDLPASLRRVMVNGEWVTLSATDGTRGRSVVEYRRKGEDHLWVKFFDGRQTAASATLRAHYGDDPDRPWGADMIGVGITYAVVTARFSPEVHRGVPELLFELDGARLYDPRRDSSVGGSGSQRWSDPASWCGFGDPACENPVVQIYNIMLGLRDPVTAGHLWGGTDILQRDLPVASWFAAMNECDAPMPADSGLEEPQYRAGIEIALEDETEPADVIDELLKACQGQIAEAAGAWVIRAGPPGAAVFAFSDDDVIVTSPEELDPFPGLDQVWNGVSARYPEPEDGWAEREAPIRLDASARAEDGGRLRVAPLQVPTVGYRAQVQRLMASALKDGRRFRRHSVVLPPEARALGPLDVVEWTSARHGYAAKQFTVDLLEDLPSGCVALALREIDPADYDFAPADLLPTTVGFLGRPPRLPQPLDFGAEGVSLPDAAGTARRPGIRLDWNPLRKATGVRYQLQLTDRPDDLPLLGGHDTSDDDLSPSPLEVFAGAPLEVVAGEPLVAAYLADILAGTTIITAGVLPAAAYRIRARYVPNGGWCPWIEVETPDTRVSALDLDAALNSRIDDAQSKADAAASDAANAIAAAVEARGIAEALAGETIAELEALLAALAGVDAGDIVENRLLALRALQSGWNADPTFQLWASGSPQMWTATGLSGIGGPFAGFYGGGLALDIGAGAVAVTLTASSAVAGQMDAADPDAPWLVLYALVTFASGNADALRLRAEWLPAGGATWVAGDMKGLTAPVGSFTELGVGAKPGVMQGVEVLVRRPAGLGADADAVRLVLQKTSTVTSAVDCDVHLLGLRQASEAEIAAEEAAGALAAAVSTLSTTITGVADALAAYRIAADAAVGAVAANLAANYLTTASVTAAIAAAQTTLTSAIGAVSTTLSTNHYTKSEVEGGISSAVGVASTSLGGQIDDVAADLVDEAAFRVSGDEALAGRVSTIEARSDPGSIVSNGSFATGSFAGWSFPGGIPATFSVVARGGTASAQGTCPSPWMVRITADATTARTIYNETREAKQGDVCSVSALYAAGGTTRDVTLRFIVRFLDNNGAATASPFTEVLNYGGTAWSRIQTPGTAAPANTAFVRFELQRLQGGSGDAFVTGIEGRKGDGAALARISAVESVAAGASGAITSLQTSINASFGSQSAFLSQTSTAVATVGALTSAWVFRQKAGAAVGTAEAVAFAAPDGTPVSAFSLDYDYINLEGRVSARDIVITDSTNLVTDDQLQTPAIWVDAAEWTMALNTNQAASYSLGEVRWVGTGTTGNAISTGTPFAVNAGDKLACSFQVRSQGGQYRAYAQLQFFNASGTQVSIFSFGVTLTSITTFVNVAPAITTVPVGAVTAVWRWVVDRANTTSSMVRFMGPRVRRQSPTVEIADGAITAEKANFADLGAVVATLGTCTITSALNFADGVIVTGAVALNAISDIGAASRTSPLTLSNENQWYTMCSLTVNVATGSTVLLTNIAYVSASRWNTDYSTTLDHSGDVDYRVLRGATQIFLGMQSEYVDETPGSGNVTYHFQAYSTKAPDSVGHPLNGNPSFPIHTTTRISAAVVNSARLVVKAFKR